MRAFVCATALICLCGFALAQAQTPAGSPIVDREPLQTRIQDPGTAILQLNVRDLDGWVRTLKAAGYPTVSLDGQAVTIGASTRIAIVRDPNNLYLELIQR
jgi:hypothetical protein